MTNTGPSVDDVERTSRDITIAQWGVAAVVMVGSAIAGGFTFHYLGEHPALGVITALAVDLALATWLRIGRRLRDVGIITVTGMILEVVTLGQTLFLNGGSALFRGINPDSATARVALTVAHCFIPVVLFLISLAGAEAQHKLVVVRRNKQAADTAEEQARDALLTRHANTARDTATAAHSRAVELRKQAEQEQEQAEQARVTAEALRVSTQAEITATQAAEQALNNQRRNSGGTGTEQPGATREQRRDWVRQQHKIGRHPTPAEVNKRFGSPRNGAAVVAEVLAEAQPKPTLKAVPGGKR